MSARLHTIQDRRGHSRLPVLLTCQFRWDSVTYDAMVVDLSLSGAFLSSRCVPPNRCPVTLTLKSPRVKQAVSIEGKVVRGGWFLSDRPEFSGFGVRFNRISPDLIQVLSELITVADSAPAEQAEA